MYDNLLHGTECAGNGTTKENVKVGFLQGNIMNGCEHFSPSNNKINDYDNDMEVRTISRPSQWFCDSFTVE